MNRIHKVIGDKAIATFDSEPSTELLEVITKMVELAYDHSFELQFLNGETLGSEKSCDNCDLGIFHPDTGDCKSCVNFSNWMSKI